MVGVILLSIATIVGIVLIVVNVKTLIHKGDLTINVRILIYTLFCLILIIQDHAYF